MIKILDEYTVVIENRSGDEISDLIDGLNRLKEKIQEWDKLDLTLDFNKGEITGRIIPREEEIIKVIF